MGGGDVTMALLVGSVLGVSAIVAFFIAFLIGSLVGLYMILVMKRSRKTKVPFGPFLAIGSYVGVLCGDVLLRVYTDLWT
jgi:leader peptidase (prepilin peptidase)/N-methyltransferase